MSSNSHPGRQSFARIVVLTLALLGILASVWMARHWKTGEIAVNPDELRRPPSLPSGSSGTLSSPVPAAADRPMLSLPDTSPEILKLNNLGIAAMEQFDFAKASTLFRSAWEKNPRFVPAEINLGIALFYDRKPRKAIEELRKALSRNPNRIEARFVLAVALRGSGEREEALQNFKAVLEQDPADPAALYFSANLETGLHRTESAIRRLEKALEYAPFNQSIYYALAKACLEAGDTGRGVKAMARFQELRAGRYGTSYGNQYLEQGRYAQAVGVAESGRDGTSRSVKFVESAKTAGLDFQHLGPAHPGPDSFPNLFADARATSVLDEAVIASYGSGAAFLDFDGDGWPDLVLGNSTASGPAETVLYRNRKDGSFERVRDSGLNFTGIAMGVAAGDYDNDGRPDLFISGYRRSALYHNESGKAFRETTSILPASDFDKTWGWTAAFADLDHDGDLDLFQTALISGAGPPSGRATLGTSSMGRKRLFRNNGNGTFSDASGLSGIDASDWTPSFLLTDFDSSRDIDLLLLSSRWRLFSNNRDGSFRDQSPRGGLDFRGRSLGAAIGDFDGDGNVDFCEPLGAGAAARFFWNTGRRFVISDWGAGTTDKFWNAYAFDFDNDGDLDILLLGDRLRLLENRGGRHFADVTAESGLDLFDHLNSRSVAAADYDRDGDLDLLVTRCGYAPLLLRNEGGNARHSVSLILKGKVDNSAGIGARVDWASAGLWQRREVTGGLGYLSQSSGSMALGLGQHQAPDYVRVLWPTGVLQTEIAPDVRKDLRIEELDRKGTSCPILYAWNGSAYHFVTDFLGGSAVGYLVAPGKYSIPDTDEYVKIRGDQLQPRGGRLSLRMVNQLEEVIWFDNVRLLAVDHPAGVEVFPNERLQSRAPFPDFHVYAVRDARTVVSAWDQNGRDWTRALASLDRTYASGFQDLGFKGYAEDHMLTLNLGDLRGVGRVVLLLDGWIDYATSSSNFAASQAGLKLAPPTMEGLDRDGRWKTVLEDMGFPAGLPKTMVVDLTGRIPLLETTAVRIRTNMRIYWDRVRVATDGPAAPVRITSVPLAAAQTAWIGYPRQSSEDGRPPFSYDYSRRDAFVPWKTHDGAFTPLGDVRELLERVDDRYVVLGHGEAIAAEFDPARLPPLPSAWVRDWLLYVDGFGKDMDLHSANPDTVGPYPHHRDLPYRRSEWQIPAQESWKAFQERFLVRWPPRW